MQLQKKTLVLVKRSLIYFFEFMIDLFELQVINKVKVTAVVVQLVEHQIVVLGVAGSSPVDRPIFSPSINRAVNFILSSILLHFFQGMEFLLFCLKVQPMSSVYSVIYVSGSTSFCQP